MCATTPLWNSSVRKATSGTPVFTQSRATAVTRQGVSSSQKKRIDRSCGARSQMTDESRWVPVGDDDVLDAARQDEVADEVRSPVARPGDGDRGHRAVPRNAARYCAPRSTSGIGSSASTSAATVHEHDLHGAPEDLEI